MLHAPYIEYPTFAGWHEDPLGMREQKPTLNSLNVDISVLKTDVGNHIKFFWATVAAGFLAIGGLYWQLFTLRGEVAMMPAQIAATAFKNAATQAAAANPDNATTQIRVGTLLLEQAEHSRIRLQPTFFSDAAADLFQAGSAAPTIRSGTALRDAMAGLARYRSSLEPPPRSDGERSQRDSALVVPPVPDAPGTVLLVTKQLENVIVVKGDGIGSSVEGLTLESAFGVGRSGQTLDGINWVNCTFVRMHIRYQGGDLHLQNVRFVDCDFDVPPTTTGNQLAAYAALARTDLLSAKSGGSKSVIG